MTRSQMVSDCRQRPYTAAIESVTTAGQARGVRQTKIHDGVHSGRFRRASSGHSNARADTHPDAADAPFATRPGSLVPGQVRSRSDARRTPPRPGSDRIPTQDRRPGGTDRPRPARTGLDASETADHFRNTTGPQWTDSERRLIYVSAAQLPLDVARPKGLEPLTF